MASSSEKSGVAPAKGHVHAGSTASAPMPDTGSAGSPSIISSIDTDTDAGARLSCVTFNDSSPTARYTPPHARVGLGNQEFADSVPVSVTEPSSSPSFQVGKAPGADIFLSPAKAEQGEGLTLSPLKISPTARLFTEPVPKIEFLENGGDNRDVSPVGGATTRALRYRSSNISGRHFVGGVDAQVAYPSSACVFVANLPEPKDDRSLEAAVTREFSKYGTVFVKIRRDNHHMPFAFCQYTKDEDARMAMSQGKGALVFGRACRTEMVKANRSFVMYKWNGATTTIEEARDALEPFGALSKLEVVRADSHTQMGPPGAVVVEFATFDPGRDLQIAFRNHEEYRVEAYDSKKLSYPSRIDTDEAFLNQYDVDRRSVFVGGINSNVDESELRELFEGIGVVVNVQIVKKPSNGPAPRVFGFIEFDRPDAPESAINEFHDTMYAGMKLRVERKVIKDRGPRRARSQYFSMTKSPSTKVIVATEPATPSVLRAVAQAENTPAENPMPVSAVSTPMTSTPPGWPYMYGSTPYTGPNYLPAYGAAYGTGGSPMTPQATPGAMGYYPGSYPQMSNMGMYYPEQPPMMGMPPMGYYPLASPTELNHSSMATNTLATTPTRGGSASGDALKVDKREPTAKA